MAFNGEYLTSQITCQMCIKEQHPIDPEVAQQVEFTLVGEFNVKMTHIKADDYCDGYFRLLMLTQRMMIKIRHRNERMQRAKEEAKATPLFFESGKESAAGKRSASAEKDKLEQPKAKRVRTEEMSKDERRKSRAV